MYPADIRFIIEHIHKDYNQKMESTIVKSIDYNAYFGDNHVVKNVNIEIPRNSVVAVMGPSGCGKTTFLRGINRMHELIPGATAKGKIMLNNEDVMEMHPIFVRLKIGMVFQRPNPFPNLSIYDNVIAGYKLNGIKLPKAEKDKIVELSLTRVALWNEVKDSLTKKGSFLSGGQQQRLCIARAVAMEPEVLLFDEPTSGLDVITAANIIELIRHCKAQNKTVIFSSHIMEEVNLLCDDLAIMHNGKILFNDTMEKFRAEHGSHSLTEAFIETVQKN